MKVGEIMAEQINIRVGINMSSITRDLNKIKSQVSSTKVNLNPSGVNNFNKSLGKTSQSMSSVIFKIAEWTSATTILFGVIRQIRESLNFAVEFDTSLTNVSYTLDTTNKKLTEMAENSFDLADGLNASVKSVMEANMIFSNLNETLDSIADKTEAVIALSNISGISISKSANAVQGLGYQFGISSDRTQEMTSALASIAATTGVAFNESIEGMISAVSRAGSVAAEAGFEYREFLATIATLQESTRLPGQTLAAGLQTILSRLNKVGDATAEEVSKVEGALDKIDIKLRESETEFRNSFDVLRDLSEVYGDLSSVQQQELGFLIAGTRQRKVFSQLMGGFGDIVERTNVALESEGEIMRLNDIFAESLKGRINDFTNSLEKLYCTFQNSDTLKSFITTGTGIVDSITTMIEKFGLLGASLNFIIPLIGIKLVLAAKSATVALIAQQATFSNFSPFILSTRESLGLFISRLFGVKTVANQATTSLIGLKLATAGLTLGLILLPVLILGIANAERKRREEFEKTFEVLKKQEEISKDTNELIEKYKELESQTKLTTKEQQELFNIKDKLSELLPTSTGVIESENIVLEDQVAILKDLNKQQLENLEAKALTALSENRNTYEDDKQTIIEYSDEIKNLQKDIDKYSVMANSGAEKVTTQGAGSYHVWNTIEYLESLTKRRKKLNEELTELEQTVLSYEMAKEVLNRMVGKTTDSIEEQTEAMRKNTISEENIKADEKKIVNLRELSEKLDETSKQTESYISNINDLSKSYDKLSNGEELSLESLRDLILKYPTIAEYIKETNDLTLNKGEVIKEVSKIEHEAMLLSTENELSLMQTKQQALYQNLLSEKKYHEISMGLMSARSDFALKKAKSNPEVKTLNDQINATKAALNVLDSIDPDTYFDELSKGSSGSGKSSSISDRYLQYTEALEQLENAEKKYNIQLKDSNISTSDKIRILNKLREGMREQMEVKRSMIEAQNEEISQIKEQIKGYVEFDKSGRNIIKVNKKVTNSEADLVKQYQSLTDAVEDTKISIIELDYAMRDNSSNIMKYNTEVYEDLVDELNNSYKQDLNNYKENEQDKFDEFKRQKDARLRELDDELQQLQRLYEDVEHVEFQEDLNEQLSKLEKERVMLAVDNSLWAKQRRSEIDQETLKINQEMDKNERKRDFDLKKRKIEDEKDTINEELRVAREGMEDRIKLIENKYEELLSNLENFESNWESLGETYGDALKRGLLPKLKEIEKEISQISGESEINTNASKSVAEASIPSGTKQLLDKYSVMSDSQVQRAISGILSAGNSDKKVYSELQEVLAARKQYNTYHDGGFVGGKPLKPQHEEVAKFLKGELAITPPQLDTAYKNLIKGFKPSSSEKSVVIHAPFTIQNAKLENPDYDMRKLSPLWARHTRDALQAKGVTI